MECIPETARKRRCEVNRARLTRLFFVATIILSTATITSSAKAADTISFQGGLFSPWDGDPGTSAAFQYAHRLGGRHYIGFELEYREFEGEILGTKDMDLRTYQIRAIYRVDLIVDSIVTPYVGVGLGIGINTFDGNDVERALELRNPGTLYSAPSVGAGIGVLALVGLDVGIPGVEWVSFFGEARFGYSAQFSAIEETNTAGGIDENTDIEVDNLGGISAHGGVRFHF